MAVDHVRDAAAGVLLRVFEHGAYLNLALDAAIRRKRFSPRGRRFLTQLVYGTARHKLLCDHVLENLVRQPLADLPRPIHTVLRMGVFQGLFCNQVTRPAMVHTSVELAKKRGHAGTARLVNAVLKRTPESLDDVRFPDREGDLDGYLSVRYSVPRWLVKQWVEEHGRETAEGLCVASCEEAPVTVRANTAKTRPDALIEGLAATGCMAEKRTAVPEEVTVVAGEPPARSRLFREGHFLVQDPASMLPPHLLEPQPGELVLDLCAAPGGKTTHIAQLTAGWARVVAVDVHARKLGLVRQSAEQLGVAGIALVCGDGRRPPLAGGFDRALVDAPCTGLGTLRRHPDLKWRIGPEDAARLAEVQRALLRSAIELCKNGAVIVYSVCTFSAAETTAVVRSILEEGRVEFDESAPEWLKQHHIGKGRYRILPHAGGLDGFFLTRLRKVS